MLLFKWELFHHALNQSWNQTRKKRPAIDRLMDLNFVCKITHLTFAICENQNADLLKYNLFEWQIIDRRGGGKERERDRLISLNRCFRRVYNYSSLQPSYTKWLQYMNTRAAVDICVQYFECLWVQIAFVQSRVWLWLLFVWLFLPHSSIPFPEATPLHLKLALNWSSASHCDVFAINPYRYLLNDFN